MTVPFDELLTGLSRQRGVLGALIVGESDGLTVASTVQHGIPVDAVAALAASLYRKARLSAETAGLGAVTVLRLEATNGQLCAIGRDDLVLVVLADARANVGLLRTTLLRSRGVLA